LGSLSLTLLGGAGDDSLAISDEEGFGGPDTRILMDGGDGHDNLLARLGFNPQPDPPGSLNLTMLGGAGNDSLAVSDEEYLGGPDTTILMDGGAGHDNLLARLGFNPQPDPPGRIMFTALGGAGNDHIDIVGFNPQPDPPGAQYLVDVQGGLGNDVITFAFSGLLNGAFQVNLNGNEGDDHIVADVSVDPSNPNSQGTIEIALLGDRGNDVLSLVAGELRGVSLRGLVDGGAGFDTAFVPARLSGFITLRNCERIFFT
jgi:hypothetical protein